jgi:hypothetical protein
VAVRYREKSVISMCPKCIIACGSYATVNCFGHVYEFIRKCLDEEKAYEVEIEEMERIIWMDSFSNWIEMNRRR